jgi:hypothetical protein
MSYEGQLHSRIAMPLSATEIAYQAILDSSIDLDPVTSQMDEEDHVLELVWATSSYCSLLFVELIYEFPRSTEDVIHVDSFADEHFPGMEILFSIFKL